LNSSHFKEKGGVMKDVPMETDKIEKGGRISFLGSKLQVYC
jgi:hypothetical protein